ncbi:MAG: DUF1385 domain-containing protein, partial [Lachnospiraceae bacterium]|nr:DUF1385 domain-containing protein [Lachnospiraceae bacterium]
MKSSGIGGQAVLEGIMMKNGTWYAVAVRKPDQTIEVKKEEYRGISAGHRWMQKPFIRGVFNFIDSLILGMQTLTYSASFYEEEAETEEPKKEGFLDRFLSPEKQESLLMAGTVVLAVVLAVGIFMILPMLCARFMERFIENSFVTALLEGVLRMAIFILYVWGISLMEDIRRTYMYHGAEHKCINCVEHGLPLTVENVRASSKEHKRCGTSFMLFVMMISIIVFMFLQMDNILLRMLSRIVFVPIIAGISYEILRLAGRSDGKLINVISKPGLMLQGLTTREPDDDMI